MLSLLINAYACSPNMGSEPGMAWNWCLNLAKYCELHIITEGEFKENIEKALPILEQGKNMHFYYNPVPYKVRKMCWNQGDWRFYKYYKEWQYKTYLIAKEIIKNNHIDIIHHLNMIGFREPGYLWKIEDKPFVWGPIDAKEKFPIEYLNGASIKAKSFIVFKNFITRMQLRFSFRVKKAINRASIVISASSESQKSLKKYFNIDSPIINETGCYTCNYNKEFKEKDTFDILWVGKIDFRKQLSLAIRAIAKLNNEKIKLHIVGSGNSTKYKDLATNLNVSSQCIWHGKISHEEVQKVMRNSDLLLFTSVAEGTPHVVLEAISNELPIVCFNVCGHGDSVNDKIGFKIPISTPQQSVNDFANAITKLEKDKNVLQQMSYNCKVRKKELSWESKALLMVEIYNKILRK